MSMEVCNIYSSYAASYTKTDSSSQKQEKDKVKAETAKPGVAGTSSAKQNVKEYLSGLEQKYGVKITVGKNTTAKSFKSFMLGASGVNNVYIESNIAEKMASDPEFAEKYEKIIAKAPEEGRQVQKEVEADGHTKLLACGTQIHANGKVTYWGVAINTRSEAGMGTKLREEAQEKLEKQKKLNKTKAEQQEKLQKKRAEKAETMEKLAEKLKTVSGEEMKIDGKDMGNGTGATIDIRF